MVKVSWKVYGIAAILTVVIFFSGIGLGYYINKEKYDTIKLEFEKLRLSQHDTEMEFILLSSFGESSCETLKYELEKTTSLASELGSKVTYYDTIELNKVPEFYNLKREYILILIRYWFYWESFKESCNSTANTILYFYSIENCSECQDQGYILSYFKDKYPDQVMTFSLDLNEDLYSLNLLKNYFNVTKAPTLIINKVKYEGLKDKSDLELLLNFH